MRLIFRLLGILMSLVEAEAGSSKDALRMCSQKHPLRQYGIEKQSRKVMGCVCRVSAGLVIPWMLHRSRHTTILTAYYGEYIITISRRKNACGQRPRQSSPRESQRTCFIFPIMHWDTHVKCSQPGTVT